MEALFACPVAVYKVMVQVSVDALPMADLKVLIEILTMTTIMKEKEIFSG
jgi:hypothetical protein